MRVVVADIEAQHAEAVAGAIGEKGGEAIGTRVDVADSASIEALAELAWSRFGGCHLLCNNAGVLATGPVAETTAADWDWVVSVNLMGVAHGVRIFVPRMIEQGEPAHIVNTASLAGLLPLEAFPIYTATKFGVVGLSEALALELAPHGIGVSVLCPGGVDTRIQTSERNRPGASATADEPADDDARVERDETLPNERSRVLSPDEVATLTLAAVRAGDLHVPTHPGWWPPVEARLADDRAGLRARAGAPGGADRRLIGA